MYIVFDIGGTTMRLAASVDGKTLGESVKTPTPSDDFSAGIAAFVAHARALAGGEKIEAIAGGVPGPLDRGKTMTTGAPHLPGWNNRPLRDELAQALECDVYLENDAAVCGLGEAHTGAGQGADIMAYLTVSTGVGGARIVKGRIDDNCFGFEPGHHVVAVGATGETVTAEDLLSGSAFEHRYGVPPREVRDSAVWEKAARDLAIVLVNTALFWSPEIIVVGGSMVTGSPAIPLDRAEHHYREMLAVFPDGPRIARAALADNAGLHGALAFLVTKHYNGGK